MQRQRGTGRVEITRRDSEPEVGCHSVGTVEAHLDHIPAVAGARVVRSNDRALPLKALAGRQPAQAPAVQDALVTEVSSR